MFAAYPDPKDVPLDHIAKVLGKTTDAVKTKAKALGLVPNRPIKHSLGKKRSRTGIRADLGIYVRSGWEANYARYLNLLVKQNQIARWEYEPKIFEFPVKKGNRFYTPDFQVWDRKGNYEWHEVKGWMDASSQTKLKRFAKYYPEETLILIDGPTYRELAKKVGPLIPEWEG